MQNTFKISHLIGHFELLRDQGVNLNDILRNTCIRPNEGMNPTYRINQDQQETILNNVERLNNDPEFGFKTGVRKNPAFFGIPMQAVLSSKNFIESGIRSYRLEHLYAPYAIVNAQPLEYKDSSYVLRCKYASELKNIKATATESTLMVIKQIAEAMSGKQAQFQRIRLAYKKPDNCNVYEKNLLCPVEFNCEETEIWMSPDTAKSPSVLRDAAFADYAEKISFGREKQSHESVGFIDKVINAINTHPTHYPSLDQIAERLCMSPRTLHRKLDKCSTSFQKIMDSIKLSYAERYILHTQLSIEEIAAETGFSSANSFRVAFKNWTKLTPTAFRKKKQHENLLRIENTLCT